MRGWIVDNCRFHSMGTEWYNEGLPEYEDTTSVSQFEGWCVLTPGGNEGYRVFGIYVTNNIVDGFGYCGLYMGNTEQLCMKNNVISKEILLEVVNKPLVNKTSPLTQMFST